jgi:LacI family transcriptional regulator
MLAEHLELSQTTVSLVLNNSPSAKSIPQETRDRVTEAANRLNYRPNYFARSLRQSKSMSVGVLAPDLSEGYFTRVMSGVVRELTAAHYFYFTACHDWKRELIEKYPRMLVERAVDGFLLLNTPADQIEVPVPVVAISAHSAAENVTNIVLDHHLAIEQALTHLHSLGHRRIAFMRGPRAIPDSEYRWESIQQVAQEMSLKIDPALVIRIDSAGWSMKDNYHPMAPEIDTDRCRDCSKKRAISPPSSASTILPLSAQFALLKMRASVCREMYRWSASTTFSPPLTPLRRSPRFASLLPKWASAAPRFCLSA